MEICETMEKMGKMTRYMGGKKKKTKLGPSTPTRLRDTKGHGLGCGSHRHGGGYNDPMNAELSPVDMQDRLQAKWVQLHDALATHFGYPVNADFDYSPLWRFLGLPLNNIGDPFTTSSYRINTHDFEREVVDLFSRLTHAPTNDVWGYVTNGGTEGNMYGLFLARELFPDGVVYYSEDTHYSVSKILRLLHVRNIMIKSRPDAAMDMEDLHETVRIHRDVPPIVFANIGTTMKGAIDDLQAIRAVFKDLALHRHYVHADAALSGMILPFVDDPPEWDFLAGIDSVAISGHKMIGSPMPCGVVLARRQHVDRIARNVEYVGSLDTTIPGSRNGLTPLILWFAWQQLGTEGFRRRIQHCLDMADYALDRLRQIGRNPWRHRHSITVVFERPSARLAHRWQLAVQDDIAHIITMPQTTRDLVDRFVAELAQDTMDPREDFRR